MKIHHYDPSAIKMIIDICNFNYTRTLINCFIMADPEIFQQLRSKTSVFSWYVPRPFDPQLSTIQLWKKKTKKAKTSVQLMGKKCINSLLAMIANSTFQSSTGTLLSLIHNM